jgi:hypothetical protein
MNMFGTTQFMAAEGVSNGGRPCLPTRLMVSLVHLKHMFSMAKGKRLIAQTRSHKTKDKQLKLYNWHAPKVAFIFKGKRHNLYKFGVMLYIATMLKETLFVGARLFPGNRYDGHTLSEQVVQADILMQATGLGKFARELRQILASKPLNAGSMNWAMA